MCNTEYVNCVLQYKILAVQLSIKNIFFLQVTTAVKFLTNPSVQRCTIESKERFLRGKGLTDPEIQKAIGKCTEMLDVPSMTSELMFFHQSRRSWFRDNVLPLLVYGGFMYGAYWFYKVSDFK